jgi:uncharacterized protein (DUF427 family)
MPITIKEKSTSTPLASAEPGVGVEKYEGNWYFDPSAVHSESLKTTERTYTCPYKGTCNWVDFVGPDGSTVKDVAWIYPNPKPGHEIIRGRYAFYAGSRGGTVQEG